MPNQLAPPEQNQRRDIVCRSLQVRAESVNEQERSVEAVFATEERVAVFDMSSWSMIEEVLRMDGAVLPASAPMLNNHWRWSLDDVYGSARNARVEGNQVIGRLYFVDEDEMVEKAWNKVRQGHLSNVSVGYRIIASTMIRAGRTMEVAGRKYKAGQQPLRVVTKWEMREVSLVPIGADSLAKIRSEVVPTTQTVTLALVLRDLVAEYVARGFERREMIHDLADSSGLSAGCVEDVIAGRVSCDRPDCLRGFAAVLDCETDLLEAAVADDRS